LYLEKKVWEIRNTIGISEYEIRQKGTYNMLNSLDKRGSAVRYLKSLYSFENALGNPQHKQGTRKLETGVTHTADNKGETSF
jgi:hypothetical protein